jgi:hypothetical protein
METVARRLGRLAGTGAGVGAFEDDPQLVAGQHHVPVDRRQIAPAHLCIVLDKLIGGCKTLPWRDRDVGGARDIGFRPCCEEPPEIEQGIADRAEFPVDHRGNVSRIRADKDICQVEVAMDDARPELGRPVRVEPIGDLIDTGDRRRTRPAGQFGIARQLRLPASDLSFEIVVGLPEPIEPGG